MSDMSFHIRQFVPACSDGEEMEQRTALLVARDFAAAQRGRLFSDWALALSAEAHAIAGQFVFAPVPVDRLTIAVAYCRNLVQAAYLAEHLSEEGAAQ